MAYFSHSTITLALSLLCISENAHAFPDKTYTTAEIDAYHDHIKSQVILVRDGKSFCGGTILNDRLVLTATQCIANAQAGQLQAAPIFVFAFIVDRVKGGRQEKRILRHVKNIFVQEEYRHPLNRSDIAILKLTEGFGAKSGVRWLPLPPRREVHKNYRARVSGFSVDVSTYPMDVKLQDVEVLSEKACHQIWGDRYENNQICDNFIPSGTDCYEITGSGLVANGMIIGVAYRQEPCVAGGGRSLAIYTKVKPYTDWILQVASYKD